MFVDLEKAFDRVPRVLIESSLWKKGGCELNSMCNMWLLGAWTMYGSTGKFGKSGTGFCVQNVQR